MPGTSGPTPRARAGSRRDDAARLAVLHAADDLLVEHGFTKLSIEAIARRAGVAKQTIYRWWPSKFEVLLDTLIEDTAKRLPVPTGPATARSVETYIRSFARFLSRDPAGAVLLALIAEAQHDPDSATSFRERYLAPRRRQERALLVSAIDAGHVSPRLGPDTTIDALLGPLVYRAITGASIPRDLLDMLIADVLRPTARDANHATP